jgi:hypothetical protein
VLKFAATSQARDLALYTSNVLPEEHSNRVSDIRELHRRCETGFPQERPPLQSLSRIAAQRSEQFLQFRLCPIECLVG